MNLETIAFICFMNNKTKKLKFSEHNNGPFHHYDPYSCKNFRGCEKNEASYNVFQLDAFVNTTAISDIKQFPKVTQAIDAIDVSERTMLSLTQTIQNILENMLQMSSFNLTTYRSTIGAPTPEKDLATFIDQMQRVALQVSLENVLENLIYVCRLLIKMGKIIL